MCLEEPVSIADYMEWSADVVAMHRSETWRKRHALDSFLGRGLEGLHLGTFLHVLGDRVDLRNQTLTQSNHPLCCRQVSVHQQQVLLGQQQDLPLAQRHVCQQHLVPVSPLLQDLKQL